MYQIAEENGVENLVAGAWGCGVFMQDPYTVATLLIGAARNYNIPNIYFAIPDRNSQNFRAYKQLIIARKDLNMSPGKLAQSWKKRVLKGLSLVLDLDQWKLNINYTIKGLWRKDERLKVQPFIFFSLLRLKVRFRF